MIELGNLFKKELIILDKSFKTKEEALRFFAFNLVQHKYAKNENDVIELALKRESEFSTGVGNQIAIPHIRDNVMNSNVITFARIEPIDWQSIDNKNVKYVFFITLTTEGAIDSHMKIIASLSSLFLNKDFVDKLENVDSLDSLVKLIENKLELENVGKESESDYEKKYDIVAVTACPTGIAHTFMARDALKKAAIELGIKIKVETEGTEGVKNKLSQPEIDNAKGVIIAADRNLDLSRFSNHSNVLEISTGAVIKNAKQEIQKSLDKKGKKFTSNVKTLSSDSNDDLISFKGFGKRMYKSLMTGVSYMLPFVIFGGIIIALAFLFDIGSQPENNLGMNRDVAKWFKTLGGLSFDVMVPILAAYITFAVIGRLGILPGFIVGLIAQGKFLFWLNPKTGEVDWFKLNNSEGGAQSGVFGAIIGAFVVSIILIALIKYVFSYIPDVLSGIKNILIIPLFGTLIAVSAFWIVNIPLIYVNYGFTQLLELLEGRQYIAWLLGLVIGVMMAFDLGGPVNKAAYVFATTSLSISNHATISMAASMASGMTPPIGIALSCTFFKQLWTKDERQTGLLNYIMGLTFISEGAIPFTLSKPKIIVPSNVIGGAITGLLIGAFGISINAPHGGILTIALAKLDTNYWSGIDDKLSIGLGVSLFIAAILIGAVVEMFMIYILSKIFKSKNNKFNKASNNVDNNNW